MSKKSPQLRFEGFTDDWEQRKLNEVSDIYDGTHQTPKYQDDGVMFLSVENIKTLTSNKFISREAFEDEFKIRPQRGDVLMTRIGDIGTANVVETDEDLAYYVSLALFKSEELNPYFLQASIYAPFVQDQIWKRTLHIAFPKKINKNEIGQVPINVPTLAEQTKIGSFFKQLDNTITLHQRKLDLLKEQKKGYLQKMFPKNGEKVPELRFAGFADDWEERKFKDNIVSIQTGTNLLGSTVNEGTPLIKMGNLQRGYFSFKKLEYLDSNSNVGSEDIVNYGDFLFNTRNTLELVGKGATWTGIGGKYAFNSNIARFKFDGIDTIFFNYLYNTQQVISQVHARAVGTTSVSAVYPRDLNSLLYYLPSIEEQQKIGSFFKQLDDTIALHQRKLDLLKEQKKGFLQKMFM